uniref:Inositol-3-phosphate synthase n=1 Tax=Plectus sambesii TaxID=2011161 RepID=A0A914XL13_9BILA
MVQSNQLLYPDGKNPDHVIVIKYVPFVGDSKRAMDEYTSSIFMGGLQTMVIHNTCEDSLLAAPLIIDLAIITELCSRIEYANKATSGQFEAFHPVLSLLSCLLKAPAVPEGTPVCNALMKQFKTLTKLVCACAGLAADTDIQLEFFTKQHEDDDVPVANGTQKTVKKATGAENGWHANGVTEANGHHHANGVTNGAHHTNGVANGTH